tara:strand:- start:41 stop:445 length:405 start_codon:yes stop_codon:yes gene_type:complete
MRVTALLTILCWMVIFIGCPKKEPKYTYNPTPFDSLMRLGDSAIKVLSTQRIEERQMVDSLHSTIDHIAYTSRNEIQGYAAQLQEKEVRRILRKDSIIWVRKYDTIVTKIEVIKYDTIYKDTIIYHSIFKKKLF